MKDVFLSHTHSDKKEYVSPFAYELDARNITYWLDSAEIKWGEKITSKINEGLKESNFVVVFLSKAFVGRNWPESELAAALNKENSEGRTVVLPIVIGDPNEILAQYPLLRDKAYLSWDEMGIETIVSELQNLMFIANPKPNIFAKIRRTNHIVPISPDRVLRFLSELDSHGTFSPTYVCAELQKCGFLADVLPNNMGIELNGYKLSLYNPNKGQPGDWGKPGIWSLQLGMLLYQTLTGALYIRHHLGRGWEYRRIIRCLREHFTEKLREAESAKPNKKA